MPPVLLRGELYLAMSIPRRIRRHVPNLVPIGRAVWQLPQTFEFWPPKKPKMSPGVLWGDLYLAYVHSQMNPQTCTEFGANDIGPSVWQLLQTFWMFDPLKPPSAPLCLEGQFVWRISIPRWICTCVPNLVPIDPAVWQLQQTFEFVTP